MLKKILLIAAGLAVVGGIAAALVIFQPWGLIGWDKTPGMGIPNGNILSGHPVVQSGEWVYFVDSVMTNSITKMSEDGQQRQIFPHQVEGEYIEGLNLVGDWLYYQTYKGIYKMRTDGTEFQKICSDEIGDKLYVVDGWCYYSKRDDYRRIYRIRTNGTERQKLSDFGADWLNISEDGYIYCVNAYSTENNEPDDLIYRMRTDGSENTQIGQNPCSALGLDGEWLYYKNENDQYCLYKMRTDGTEDTKVLDFAPGEPNVTDGWIYYRDSVGYAPYKIRTDGTEKQQLSQEPCTSFSVIGDWIYCYTSPTRSLLLSAKICRMKTDGTEWEVLFNEGN